MVVDCMGRDWTDTKIIMLHEGKNDDGIRAFFMDVWELYVKVREY